MVQVRLRAMFSACVALAAGMLPACPDPAVADVAPDQAVQSDVADTGGLSDAAEETDATSGGDAPADDLVVAELGPSDDGVDGSAGDTALADALATDAFSDGAAVGDAAVGDAPPSDGVAGDGAATDASPVDAPVGDGAVGDVPPGDALAGDTASGDEVGGDVPSADGSAGDAIEDDLTPGETSSSDASAGDTPVTDTSLPDTSLDDVAEDGAADSLAGDAVSDAGAIPECAPTGPGQFVSGVVFQPTAPDDCTLTEVIVSGVHIGLNYDFGTTVTSVCQPPFICGAIESIITLNLTATKSASNPAGPDFEHTLELGTLKAYPSCVVVKYVANGALQETFRTTLMVESCL